MIDDALVSELDKRIRYIALKMCRHLPATVEADDLVSQGWVGALEAQNTFNKNFGGSFVNFAQIRIEGAMKSFLREYCDPLTRDHRRLVGKDYTVPILELDAPMFDDGVGYQLAAKKDTHTEVKILLDTLLERTQLNDRSRSILIDYFQHEITLKEIGKKHTCTESRVSQLITAACAKIRSTESAQAKRCTYCHAPLRRRKQIRGNKTYYRDSTARWFCSRRCQNIGRWANSPKKKLPEKIVLLDLYTNKKWTIQRIATQYRCAKHAVRCALIRYGIARRPKNKPPNRVCKVCGCKVFRRQACTKARCRSAFQAARTQ